MPRKVDQNLIVGLDIGTSKVVAIVAEVLSDGIEILGFGSHPSHGLKKGVVVNIDSTVQSVQKAIEEAELMAGCQINSVYVCISGGHIRSLNSQGIVPITDKEVHEADVERVIDAAKAVAIPADQKILHVLPQEFMIDRQEGILDPVGMSGVRLEAKIHMVTGSVSAAQNIVNCVRRCGLNVDDMILSQLASSDAVLSQDEKQLGVCLIDIGGGTTDIAVYFDGAIRHTAVLPIAGDQVTNDIAVALRTPTQSAETLKIQHACALRAMADPNRNIDVPRIGEKAYETISQVQLTEVVEPRFEELFTLVQNELSRLGLADLLGSGIVLTGGSAKMKGIVELGEEVFRRPVRVGVPYGVSGLPDVIDNPILSTGVGLLLYGARSQNKRVRLSFQHLGLHGFVGRLKQWFQGNF